MIRIKIALNTSDSPFGWRGKNKGASVFFSDDTHFMHENHELKLNANNEVHFQLRVRNGSVSFSWDSLLQTVNYGPTSSWRAVNLETLITWKHQYQLRDIAIKSENFFELRNQRKFMPNLTKFISIFPS